MIKWFFFFAWCLSTQAQNVTNIVNNTTKVGPGTNVSNVISGGGGGGGTVFVLSGHGSAESDFTSNLGFSAIPASDMTVTALGRIKVAGNNQDHTIYLISEDGNTIIAQATITGAEMAAASTDTYVYKNITPVAITIVGGGTTGYLFVSSEVNGGDSWYNDGVITTTSDATVFGSRFSNGVSYSLGVPGSHSYVPVNFKYTVP